MSNRGSRSAHRSAISASSASLIDVQSLVSTWMDICRSVLLGLLAVCTAGPGLPWNPRAARPLGLDGYGPPRQEPYRRFYGIWSRLSYPVPIDRRGAAVLGGERPRQG